MIVTLIAIGIGLVLGAAWGEAFGAVTGALLACGRSSFAGHGYS